MDESAEPYVATLSSSEAERLRQWHERSYRRLTAATEPVMFDWRGLRLEVPPGVFPPVSADLLAAAVHGEVRAGERVLDLGTGSGVNALVAARAGAQVVATDHNPDAVQAAAANAQRNGLADTIEFRTGDLYDVVDGQFDLIVFDPPFRWFAPRDRAETAITDHGYRTLQRFVAHTRDVLAPGGRALVHFGTTADLGYLRRLLAQHRYCTGELAEQRLDQDGHHVTYHVLRLTPSDQALMIARDDPAEPAVRALLETHLAWSHTVTPAGHVHALDVDALRAPDISFYSARRDGDLVGVGALRALDTGHAEIKSMHTAQRVRGSGIGRAMVEHLVAVARNRGHRRVSLETGTMDAFLPARTLYRSLGFATCEPFGDYTANDHSVCMTLALA